MKLYISTLHFRDRTFITTSTSKKRAIDKIYNAYNDVILPKLSHYESLHGLSKTALIKQGLIEVLETELDHLKII